MFYASGHKVISSVQGLKDESGGPDMLEKRKSWSGLAHAFCWEQFCSELSFNGTGIILREVMGIFVSRQVLKKIYF